MNQDLLNRLAVMWAAADPGFAEALHAAVDAPNRAYGEAPFSDLPKVEFESKLAAVARKIEDIELELRRRAAEREKDEAARRYDELLTDAQASAAPLEAAAAEGGPKP